MAEWYRDHREEVRDRQVGYEEQHREQIAARKAAYRAEHPETVRAQRAAWYAANREQEAASHKRRREASLTEARERERAASARYRERKRQARAAASTGDSQDVNMTDLPPRGQHSIAAEPAQLRRPQGAELYDPILQPDSRLPRQLTPGQLARPAEELWAEIEHDPRYVAAALRDLAGRTALVPSDATGFRELQAPDEPAPWGQVHSEAGRVYEQIVAERNALRRQGMAAAQAAHRASVEPALADAAQRMPAHRCLQRALVAEQHAPGQRMAARLADTGRARPDLHPLGMTEVMYADHDRLDNDPIIGSWQQRGLVQPPGAESAALR